MHYKVFEQSKRTSKRCVDAMAGRWSEDERWWVNFLSRRKLRTNVEGDRQLHLTKSKAKFCTSEKQTGDLCVHHNDF